MQGSDEEFDEEFDEQHDPTGVRDLLAGLRDTPMPQDVVDRIQARLDQELADRARGGPGSVTPFPTRDEAPTYSLHGGDAEQADDELAGRRRRRAARVLWLGGVAAAGLAVLTLTMGQLGDQQADTAAQLPAGDSQRSEAGTGAEQADSEQADSEQADSDQNDSGHDLAADGVVVLPEVALGADPVADLRAGLAEHEEQEEDSGINVAPQAEPGTGLSPAEARACAEVADPDGTVARYAVAPATDERFPGPVIAVLGLDEESDEGAEGTGRAWIVEASCTTGEAARILDTVEVG